MGCCSRGRERLKHTEMKWQVKEMERLVKEVICVMSKTLRRRLEVIYCRVEVVIDHRLSAWCSPW
jgi:hypothetical protein